MNNKEFDGFLNELQKLGLDKAASAVAEAAEKYDTAKSYDEENTMRLPLGWSPMLRQLSDGMVIDTELEKLLVNKIAFKRAKSPAESEWN
ncbi:hypothetical protein LWI28_015899 [Acer negundo]|uniref:Uncharacterized protein n=1 Tax=Acer negundo TaxID=4023 RepID=A0AAD5JBX7_ACENE|nr:hypothetical protein LWI28_015899 [Acer negundo]